MRVGLFEVSSQKKALEELAKLVEKATIDPLVRNAALQITHDCDQRDDLCEVTAVFNAVKTGTDAVAGLQDGLRYMSDPRWADFFTAPSRMLKQLASGINGGDCLPADTLLLGAGYKPFVISEAKVGDLVMGDGKWVRITQVMDKGIQEILEFKLNNGCVLRCTADHKLFVVPRSPRKGHPAGERENAIEVRAGDVRPGDDLLTIESLPEGRESLETERAWMLGTFIADGWVEYSRVDNRPLRCAISGKDGFRKEGQKTRAEEFCDANGMNCRWDKRYLSINDETLAAWFAGCGHTAVNKHLPSLDFDRRTAEALLSGLAADCEVRDSVFGTISPQLALQYRLLLRMTGVSAHIARVEDHGGLGKNPIYRVTPRELNSAVRPHARVQSISLGEAEPTFDIEVEGHRFYLPETDLVVHNCDDHAALIAGLLGSLGFVVGLRVWGRKKGEFTHVYAVVGLPKIGPTEFAGLDTTVDESEVGWEPPGGHVLTAVLDGS